MVGVSSPLLGRDARAGVRLLLGLVLGTSMATAVIALAVQLLSSAVEWLPYRLPGAYLALLVFGVLDLGGLTPQAHRQTPQQLVRQLSSGILGVVWGFDIGLVVTTLKVTSLLWAASAWFIIAGPGWPALPIVVYSFTWCIGELVLAALGRVGSYQAVIDVLNTARRGWPWSRFSGGILVAVSLLGSMAALG